MVVRLVLAVIFTASFLSLDASAQWRGRSGYAGITVFEDPDFRGDSVSFRDEIPDLRQHRLNDHISSLHVEGNQAWEVCRDVHFGGGCRVVTGSIDDLRQEGWNDRISSLRPAGFGRRDGNVRGNRDIYGNDGYGNDRNRRDRNRAVQSRLVLYERTNYGGDSRDVMNGSSGLRPTGDRFRSVQVEAGTWELCEGTSRNSRCVTVSRDVPDLRSVGLRNGATTVREVSNQNNARWF